MDVVDDQDFDTRLMFYHAKMMHLRVRMERIMARDSQSMDIAACDKHRILDSLASFVSAYCEAADAYCVRVTEFRREFESRIGRKIPRVDVVDAMESRGFLARGQNFHGIRLKK